MVAAVLKDEDRHVRYTLEAVTDLLPRRKADEVLHAHRRAEAKANLRFSRDRMRTFLESRCPGASFVLRTGFTSPWLGTWWRQPTSSGLRSTLAWRPWR